MNQEGTGKERFNVWDGLNLVAQITGLILGPLILLGGLGLWAAQALGGRKIIFVASIIAAFAISNLLVYRKAVEITKRYR